MNQNYKRHSRQTLSGFCLFSCKALRCGSSCTAFTSCCRRWLVFSLMCFCNNAAVSSEAQQRYLVSRCAGVGALPPVCFPLLLSEVYPQSQQECFLFTSLSCLRAFCLKLILLRRCWISSEWKVKYLQILSSLLHRNSLRFSDISHHISFDSVEWRRAGAHTQLYTLPPVHTLSL